MDTVTIRNPNLTSNFPLWEVENYQKKNVVRFIKYPCSLKYGTDIGKSRYERAIPAGTVSGCLVLRVCSVTSDSLQPQRL